MSAEPLVAIVNSNEDTVEMLRIMLQQHGFTAIATAHVRDLKLGRVDLLAFLEQHDPKVIIYDITIPYEENWRFLQLLLTSDAMQGRRVVLTTTNKRALETLVGEKTEVQEILGKPYDLEQIVDAVKKAIQA
jgi:CheY-like chemotaxis protein